MALGAPLTLGDAAQTIIWPLIVYLLVALLAASRRPEALTGDSLEARVTATDGINEYWDPEPLAEGGTEQAMARALAWWKAHRR